MQKKCLSFLYFVVISCYCVLGFPRRIKLGGLFEKDDPCQQAFVLSVNAINKLRHTSEDLANVLFMPESNVITKDAFETSQTVCSLFENRVAAIFGPFDKVSAEHVQSMCESTDMPNVVARWDFEPVRMSALNLYPHAESLSMVFYQLVTLMEWKKFTILYDSSESLVRMNKLLKRWDPNGYPVTIRHLGNGPNYRKILNEIKQSDDVNIIIDCSYNILSEVLKQSQQVGILSDRHKIIISNLDLHTLDLNPYQYSGVNITGVRLVDVESTKTQHTFKKFLSGMGLDSLTQLRVEPALIYDAVQFFARTFKQINGIGSSKMRALSCNGSDSWEFGASLTNFMRTTEMRGLTGLIKFHGNGFRSEFELDIVQLTTKGLKKIGVYNSTSGFDWRSDGRSVLLQEDLELQNTTFKVLIALSPPYNMLKESSIMRTGNDRYEGFAIEIIQELSKILHFNYTFIETDPDYGTRGKDNKWSGMLGMIIDGEADLAITDLTITADRESAVDFTMPFMNLGISILYRKPTKAPPNLLSFLSPLTIQVWICLIVAYIGTSAVFTVIGRMSPAEWNNPDPCIEDPDELQNQFTFSNSLWCTIGTITQQGSEIGPIGASTKILGCAWGFFCMAIVNLYIANLSAALMIETTVKPIKSAEDLANLNGRIKYGAKKNGSTFNFFKGSNYSIYYKMYEYMEANAKEVLTESNDEGRDKVLDASNDYAFLMESSSIQYIVQRHCNLTQIGGLLDAKGYGIAMRKNFKYRNKFNTAILQLQETGAITGMQKKWWEEKRGGGKCNQIGGSSSAANPMTLQHVGGVFLFLAIVVALAAPVAFGEFIWDIFQYSKKENLNFKHEFMEEMRFVLKCKGTVKKARRRRSASQTSEPISIRDTPPYGLVPQVLTTLHN